MLAEQKENVDNGWLKKMTELVFVAIKLFVVKLQEIA